eukprot:GHVT01023426.1.p1 GENE.GHVT01023426.1~~GHVT01023426.1.p1  ORF type:complete len:362 (+),score=54.73 GHVT01023426.1:238-1323(+)
MLQVALSLEAGRPSVPPAARGWLDRQRQTRRPAAAKELPEFSALARGGPRRLWLLAAAACTLACAFPTCRAARGTLDPVHPYGKEYTGKARPANYSRVARLLQKYEPKPEVQWLTANTLRIVVRGADSSGEISDTSAMSMLRNCARNKNLSEILPLALALGKINPDVKMVVHEVPLAASLELDGRVAPLPKKAIEQFLIDGTLAADLKAWVDASFNPEAASCTIDSPKDAPYKLRRINKRVYIMNEGEEVCVNSFDLSELEPNETEKEKIAREVKSSETHAKAANYLIRKYGKRLKFPAYDGHAEVGAILSDGAWVVPVRSGNCFIYFNWGELQQLATGRLTRCLTDTSVRQLSTSALTGL